MADKSVARLPTGRRAALKMPPLSPRRVSAESLQEHRELQAKHAELEETHNKTLVELKLAENENDNLVSDVAGKDNELATTQRALATNKQAFEHHKSESNKKLKEANQQRDEANAALTKTAQDLAATKNKNSQLQQQTKTLESEKKEAIVQALKCDQELRDLQIKCDSLIQKQGQDVTATVTTTTNVTQSASTGGNLKTTGL